MFKELHHTSQNSTPPANTGRIMAGVLAAFFSLGAAACPDSDLYDSFAPTPSVGVHATSGVTTDYYFQSVDQGLTESKTTLLSVDLARTATLQPVAPAGTGGVPGLIEYCVYPNSGEVPENIAAIAGGENGGAWDHDSDEDYFSFSRPGGDSTNIPFDGAFVLIGSANDSGPVDFLVHINNYEECSTLYGRKDLKTCWAKPLVCPEGKTPCSSWVRS